MEDLWLVHPKAFVHFHCATPTQWDRLCLSFPMHVSGGAQ